MCYLMTRLFQLSQLLCEICIDSVVSVRYNSSIEAVARHTARTRELLAYPCPKSFLTIFPSRLAAAYFDVSVLAAVAAIL